MTSLYVFFTVLKHNARETEMPLFRSSADCIFCKIVSGKDEKTHVLAETPNVAVFKDIRPAADFHLLAIPKEHYAHAKCLNRTHIDLIDELVRVGKSTLEKLIEETRGEKPSDLESELRVGFHWPPFISVSHLHFHLIYPSSGISGIPRIIGEFNPKTWWFRSPKWLRNRLRSIEIDPKRSTSSDTTVSKTN